MERQRYVVALIALATLAGFAENSAQAQGNDGARLGVRSGRARQFHMARERWRQMSPDDRQRMRANAARWLQLPPEERRQLRMKEGLRRQQIRQEAEEAMRGSGLQLEAEKRALYEQRYMQERRRIERTLRQELEEKRQREMAPVMEGLKKEFGQPQGGASSVAPSTSASPSPQK